MGRWCANIHFGGNSMIVIVCHFLCASFVHSFSHPNTRARQSQSRPNFIFNNQMTPGFDLASARVTAPYPSSSAYFIDENRFYIANRANSSHCKLCRFNEGKSVWCSLDINVIWLWQHFFALVVVVGRYIKYWWDSNPLDFPRAALRISTIHRMLLKLFATEVHTHSFTRATIPKWKCRTL